MKAYTKVAILSCLVNGFLTAVKYSLGEASQSLALKADAVHSLADVVSSLSILAGIMISDRKTKTFPFGLYKIENLAALGSSVFIFFAAFEIVNEVVHTEQRESIQNAGLVSGGIIFILVVAYVFSRYELKAGLKAGSPSLVADARHIATDMLSSLVILVAILGSYLGASLDSYVAVFVAALVARIGFSILLDSLKVLLDATLDYSTLNGIRQVIESHPLVIGISSLGGRSSGRYKFVEADVRIDARLLKEAHHAVSHLEEEILDRWPDIDRILVHYEPVQKEIIRIAAPVELLEGAQPQLNSPLSEHFGEAPFFAILRKETRADSVNFERFVENHFKNLENHRGVKTAEFLAEQGVDEVWICSSLKGKGAGYALEALGIEVITIEPAVVGDLTLQPEKEVLEAHELSSPCSV